MSIDRQRPPRWAEGILERVLRERDRETVVGDLREEYAEAVLPKRGRVGANLWYLRQVLSLLPRSLGEGDPVRKMLLPLSMFTFACACWLGAMEMTLRHPGYGMRVGVAALIALISIATVVVRMADIGMGVGAGAGFRGERWLRAGAVVLIGIGGQAFLRNARAAHFEGFVLVISVALTMQGLLMLVSGIGRKQRARQDPIDSEPIC
jgi:hypothetical protein